jgi:type II secretory ATPase GspE/PulE/Tfp pilus assembly ATPase PilB-like protein
LVIAQRLVRRLDESSKQEYDPDDATRNWVKSVLKDLPSHVQAPDLDTFKLWKPVVSDDSPFGYKGRMVVMEQLVVGDEIQKFLRGDIAEFHTELIEDTAKKNGMVTLLQEGVLAALRGETTLDEVNRVI